MAEDTTIVNTQPDTRQRKMSSASRTQLDNHNNSDKQSNVTQTFDTCEFGNPPTVTRQRAFTEFSVKAHNAPLVRDVVRARDDSTITDLIFEFGRHSATDNTDLDLNSISRDTTKRKVRSVSPALPVKCSLDVGEWSSHAGDKNTRKTSAPSKLENTAMNPKPRKMSIIYYTLYKLRTLPMPSFRRISSSLPSSPLSKDSRCDYDASTPPESPPEAEIEPELNSTASAMYSYDLKTNKLLEKKYKKTQHLPRDHQKEKRRNKRFPRSKSAGSAKDVPAHALFLKYTVAQAKRRTDRHSFDLHVKSSMERTLGDSDSESENAFSDLRTGGAAVKSKKKTLAQGMKDKLAFLRKRNPDSGLSGKDALEKPPPEVALRWSQGFFHLLNDKYGLELFREFLRTEFSEENIEFWIACEEYKNSKAGSYLPTAQIIYTDFVAVQAPREVNLDSKTRIKTLDNMQSPDRETFEAAQKRIQNLMEKDSYPRFLNSEVYQEMLGEHRHKFALKS